MGRRSRSTRFLRTGDEGRQTWPPGDMHLHHPHLITPATGVCDRQKHRGRSPDRRGLFERHPAQQPVCRSRLRVGRAGGRTYTTLRGGDWAGGRPRGASAGGEQRSELVRVDTRGDLMRGRAPGQLAAKHGRLPPVITSRGSIAALPHSFDEEEPEGVEQPTRTSLKLIPQARPAPRHCQHARAA